MDKKERLLKAALKLFVEFGFHDTPTSKIAREAGVATGTLFYFFPNKDELVKAVYIDTKSKMSDYILGTIQNQQGLYNILKTYYTSALNWALSHGQEFRFIEQFNSSPYLKQIAHDEIQNHTKDLMDLFEKGIKDKIIKPLDKDMIYTLIGAHTFSVNQYLLVKQYKTKKQAEVIEETFELLWDMITV